MSVLPTCVHGMSSIMPGVLAAARAFPEAGKRDRHRSAALSTRQPGGLRPALRHNVSACLRDRADVAARPRGRGGLRAGDLPARLQRLGLVETERAGRGVAAPDRDQPGHLVAAPGAAARGGRAAPAPRRARAVGVAGPGDALRPPARAPRAAAQAGGRARPPPLPRLHQPRHRPRPGHPGADGRLAADPRQVPAAAAPDGCAGMAYCTGHRRSFRRMTRTGTEPGDFDRWLHRQLRVALEPERGPRPHPADARYAAVARRTGGRVVPIRFSIPAALGAKALIGSAVVALAAGTAGTVMTGSVNPAAWGQHVSEAVEACKAKDVNVGRCVSAIAQEHGEAVRAQHSEAVEN